VRVSLKKRFKRIVLSANFICSSSFIIGGLGILRPSPRTISTVSASNVTVPVVKCCALGHTVVGNAHMKAQAASALVHLLSIPRSSARESSSTVLADKSIATYEHSARSR
jgi:hypothetical protein